MFTKHISSLKKGFIIVVMTSLAACMTIEEKLQEQGAIRLNAEQVATHLSGHTETWIKGAGYYAPDGTISTIWEGQKSQGTYSINDQGTLCMEMNTGKTFCHFYMRNNGNIMMIVDGINAGVKVVTPGNTIP